ncbi:hypothetical protein [Salana multivorans]
MSTSCTASASVQVTAATAAIRRDSVQAAPTGRTLGVRRGGRPGLVGLLVGGGRTTAHIASAPTVVAQASCTRSSTTGSPQRTAAPGSPSSVGVAAPVRAIVTRVVTTPTTSAAPTVRQRPDAVASQPEGPGAEVGAASGSTAVPVTSSP